MKGLLNTALVFKYEENPSTYMGVMANVANVLPLTSKCDLDID